MNQLFPQIRSLSNARNLFWFLLATACSTWSEPLQTTAQTLAPPDMGGSVLRLLGAFVFVIAVFLGGVWLYRNFGRLAVRNGTPPRLHVLEAKSLGNRHALYVVAYEQQRLMLSASPTGVSLITHLPDADAVEKNVEVAPTRFSAAFQQLLGGRG